MTLKKHTLNLREGDFEQLELFYGPKGISASLVIRTLVSRRVDSLLAKLGDVPPPSMEFQE